jgi:hypothetical protein
MKLFPIDVHFSDCFEELADKIQEGGVVFAEILNDFRNATDKMPRLKEIEHEVPIEFTRICIKPSLPLWIGKTFILWRTKWTASST